MRTGYVILLAQISWIIFTAIDSLWVFQYKVHIISAVVTLLGCFLWLRRKENRIKFRNAMFTRSKQEGSFLDNLSTSINIGMISIFALLVTGFEVSKLIIAESDGYEFIRAEIVNNQTIKEKVGEIKYVALGNSMSFHYSFKAPEQVLRTSLIVFGDVGQMKVDVSAFKKYDFWKVDKLTIGD
jgi:hypothetical protein